MSEELLDATNVELNGERPTFLTVLCILTFIASGLGILGSILMVVGAGALAGYLGGAAAGGGVIWSILSLVASGLTLYGALQMWNLKAQGFMIYVAGQAVAIISTIIVSMSVGGFNVMGIVFPIVFVVLYNMNRKHLTA